MNLSYTTEHEALRQSARRLFERRGSLDKTRQLLDKKETFDHSLWMEMALDLGFQGLAIEEEFGGSGFGLLEQSVVLEEMGRVLHFSPYFSTVILAATVLGCAENVKAKARWLEGISSGEVIATVATVESDGSWSPQSVETCAKITDDTALVTGTKNFVTDAATADLMIVLADSERGSVLVALETDQSAVEVDDYPALDETRPLGTVHLKDARGTVLTSGPRTDAVLDRLRDVGAAALAAEQVGGASQTLEMAVEYAKIREQFGVPIGSFQAIKFKAADMLLKLEAARSAALYAVRAATEEDDDLPVGAAVAKAVCSEAYFDIAAESIQIHGGIGFTWEHSAHYYFKRAKSSELLFGTPVQHRERLAEMLGW